MKVLVTKTLTASTVIEVPDEMDEGAQQQLACRLADEMDMELFAREDELYWVCTEFHRPAADDVERQNSALTTELDGKETKMWEWFTVD